MYFGSIIIGSFANQLKQVRQSFLWFATVAVFNTVSVSFFQRR